MVLGGSADSRTEHFVQKIKGVRYVIPEKKEDIWEKAIIIIQKKAIIFKVNSSQRIQKNTKGLFQ